MATVTGFTAEHMLEMENATIVDGNVVGDNLILVTKDGTEINAGNVRGPQGNIGLTGPLTQAAADARYVNNTGDTMTGTTLILDHTSGSPEAIRMIHSTAPYMSFFNGATRVGYIQGRNDLFIVNAEDGNPMAFFTNGVEQMRLRTGPADEILTINGNPDALIYMRASSPSGTVYNYFGKNAGWGFRATSLVGDTLIQASDGSTRLQAKYSVTMYPGNNISTMFYPQGHVGFGKLDELEDDVPGLLWRADWNSLRSTCNVDNTTSLFLNRQGAGAGIGSEFVLFRINNTTVGSIKRTGAGVAYNETSDYRAKTVKGPISGALERLKILKPVRAIYHDDLDQTEVDTFVAHEVTPAVPEAVSGEKDAVATAADTEMSGTPIGQPILQQLDTKKLIPLLVAAVQELSAKVDDLQARLAPA